MPPEKTTPTGLGSLLTGMDLGNLMTGGLSTASSQLFVEILKSRSASVYVVEKHNLVNYFNAKNVFEAANKLNQRLNIDLTKEGIVKVNVELTTSWLPVLFGDREKERKLAAAVSNSFVEALDKINREKLSSKAKRARMYIETQLVETKARLDSVEIELMEFQQKNKTVSLPDQLKASIETAAELKSEIIKTEIELGLIGGNVREDNRTYLALQRQLQELRSQYNQMEVGSEDFLLGFKDVPELGRQLAVLFREVKIQNEVYVLLQQQYYREKIQENRDLPTVEVLDEAIIPEKPSSPRLIYSTFFGAIFIFLLISLGFVLKDRGFYNQLRGEKPVE